MAYTIWDWQKDQEEENKRKDIAYNKNPEQAPAPAKQQTGPLTQATNAYMLQKSFQGTDKAGEWGWNKGKEIYQDLKSSPTPTVEETKAFMGDPVAAPLAAEVAPVAEVAPEAVSSVLPAATETAAVVTPVAESTMVSAPLGAAAVGEGAAATAAGEGVLAAMGPVGWGIGAALLAKRFGLF